MHYTIFYTFIEWFERFCPVYTPRGERLHNCAVMALYVEVDWVLVFFVREFDVVDVSVLRVVFAEHLRALD